MDTGLIKTSSLPVPAPGYCPLSSLHNWPSLSILRWAVDLWGLPLSKMFSDGRKGKISVRDHESHLPILARKTKGLTMATWYVHRYTWFAWYLLSPVSSDALSNLLLSFRACTWLPINFCSKRDHTVIFFSVQMLHNKLQPSHFAVKFSTWALPSFAQHNPIDVKVHTQFNILENV